MRKLKTLDNILWNLTEGQKEGMGFPITYWTMKSLAYDCYALFAPAAVTIGGLMIGTVTDHLPYVNHLVPEVLGYVSNFLTGIDAQKSSQQLTGHLDYFFAGTSLTLYLLKGGNKTIFYPYINNIPMSKKDEKKEQDSTEEIWHALMNNSKNSDLKK